jgi:orotidine-5'-phosphate decarboxylase|tara:strand:+ start:43 stop:720 length:678 start_codon:yes stop_codon:yes gene_type:complete
VKKNIFVACDFSSQDEAISLIEQIKNHIFGIKIGLQYVTSTGIDGVKALTKFNLPILYDVKAFDIKNTVKGFAKSLKKIGVSYATIHLLNGEETLKSIVEEVKDIKFIGVSVLTSFSDYNKDLEKLGFKDDVKNQVQRLVKIASKANLHGVVCSPLEVKIVKKIDPKLLCFTPGIRLESSNNDDQKRTMSAKEAIDEGSDYLIIGRPLTSGNPEENIKKIIKSLE